METQYYIDDCVVAVKECIITDTGIVENCLTVDREYKIIDVDVTKEMYTILNDLNERHLFSFKNEFLTKIPKLFQ